MNRKLKVAGFILAIVTILTVSVVTIPNEASSNLDWSTPVLNDANKELGSTGYNKKSELMNRKISDELSGTLDPIIQEQQAELERLLEEYYQKKLEGLVSAEELSKLEQQIVTIRNNILIRYQKEIDQLFN